MKYQLHHPVDTKVVLEKLTFISLKELVLSLIFLNTFLHRANIKKNYYIQSVKVHLFLFLIGKERIT